MSCTDFWQPTMMCLGIVIDALPPEKRLQVVENLQLLAQVFADRGDLIGSDFARALSGEPFPMPEAKGSHLKIVK
jgi:hypothetical protein